MSAIPVGWVVQNLGAVATLQRGYDLPHKDRKRGSIPVITSSGFGDTHSESRVIGPGVVTGRYGTIGQVFYVIEDFWPLNTTLYIKDFHGNDPLFIAHLLRTIDFHSHSGKSGVPGVNRNDLHELIVHLAPVPEQRSIATALSDVDALLAKLDQFIAKKRDLKQAAMQQLLTGQTRLPGFSGEWEVKRLGDLASFFKGKGLPKSALIPFGAEPCIHYGELFTQYAETIGEIISRTDDSQNSFRSVENDVLMPTSDVTPRGLAKASCVTVDGVILGGDILVIRSDRKRVCGTFLSYVIRSEEDQVLQLVTGSTVFHLYGSDMKKFTFSMPLLSEQTAIATVLSDMDAEITALEARRDKTRALKQGMMQELLTGRIRLV
jgi:type I restriction enzyme S subunit